MNQEEQNRLELIPSFYSHESCGIQVRPLACTTYVEVRVQVWQALADQRVQLVEELLEQRCLHVEELAHAVALDYRDECFACFFLVPQLEVEQAGEVVHALSVLDERTTLHEAVEDARQSLQN